MITAGKSRVDQLLRILTSQVRAALVIVFKRRPSYYSSDIRGEIHDVKSIALVLLGDNQALLETRETGLSV